MEDCEDCENWKRRGDELFDELERTDDEYDELADKLRDMMEINGELRLLLNEKGIEHEF